MDSGSLPEVGRGENVHRHDPLHPLEASPPRRDEAEGRAVGMVQRLSPTWVARSASRASSSGKLQR
jgi:hypothetical protein